jgi:hypothetical protein
VATETKVASTTNTFTIIAIVPGIGVWSHTFRSRDAAMICKEFLEKNSLIGPTRVLMIEE